MYHISQKYSVERKEQDGGKIYSVQYHYIKLFKK